MRIPVWSRLPNPVRNWAKFNLLTFPVLAAIYTPYNYFWIGYTPAQLVKWVFTAAFFGSFANLFMQPWVTFIHGRGWVGRKAGKAA